ncbi:glycoside hydrolase family 3 N-terminal domain-containing protein [Arthrobacter alpinus]|nr:glycoside hydrolase family 3 N-terminal domain-containing protein [Arthrobacter alpinus]
MGKATVFPQPVGLAATWDEDLLQRVGQAVGREVRAKHQENPSISLNVWAPVVNPLRHPLWGRNEEGFSEDPVLTGQLAGAFCHGLRGNDPDRWQTVPTLKHFLGYNNEVDRNVSSSQLRARVLHEYELPAYSTPIAGGAVGAVMLSYNLVNGMPAHVSDLVAEHLRQWPGEQIWQS